MPSPLEHGQCRELPPGASALDSGQVSTFLRDLPGWGLAGNAIRKEFTFKTFETLTLFLNAVAWVSHRQNHHPAITLGYNRCTVEYATHSIGGLSENDFICAAKLEALLAI